MTCRLLDCLNINPPNPRAWRSCSSPRQNHNMQKQLSSTSLRLKKSPTLEEWLDEESKHHKFCVLLFYRGDWDSELWNYFSGFIDCVPALRKQGGELFAVVPKNKAEKKKMEKHLGLNFKIISDPEDQLAEKYKITTSGHERRGSRLKSLLEKACLSPTTTTRRRSISLVPSLTEVFKISHPGVLILSSKQKPETGQWQTNRTIKNHYESKEYFTPTSLNELLDLHFGRARSVARVN